jgi:hypothetical protein
VGEDANGKDVATHYEVDGTELVQVVNHTRAGVAYPVVADPTLSFGWWIYVKRNRTETHSVATSKWLPRTAYVALGCGVVGNPVIAAACGGTVTEIVNSIVSTFKGAEAVKKCVQIGYSQIGLPADWHVLTC